MKRDRQSAKLTWFRNHRSVRWPTLSSNPSIRKKLNRPTRSWPSISSPLLLTSKLRPFPTSAIVRTSLSRVPSLVTGLVSLPPVD
eukprot:1189884-Prorocentrum_minimum.AAC.2